MIRSRENVILSDSRRAHGTYSNMLWAVTKYNDYNGTYVSLDWEHHTDPKLISDALKVLERLANLERMG